LWPLRCCLSGYTSYRSSGGRNTTSSCRRHPSLGGATDTDMIVRPPSKYTRREGVADAGRRNNDCDNATRAVSYSSTIHTAPFFPIEL
jgi:hypothetical protein